MLICMCAREKTISIRSSGSSSIYVVIVQCIVRSLTLEWEKARDTTTLYDDMQFACDFHKFRQVYSHTTIVRLFVFFCVLWNMHLCIYHINMSASVLTCVTNISIEKKSITIIMCVWVCFFFFLSLYRHRVLLFPWIIGLICTPWVMFDIWPVLRYVATHLVCRTLR